MDGSELGIRLPCSPGLVFQSISGSGKENKSRSRSYHREASFHDCAAWVSATCGQVDRIYQKLTIPRFIGHQVDICPLCVHVFNHREVDSGCANRDSSQLAFAAIELLLYMPRKATPVLP
jgi:hypothetical protein